MAWRFLDNKTCPLLKAPSAGRWWILGISGPISKSRGSFSTSSITKPISLLCTPSLSLDTMSVEIRVTSNPGRPQLVIAGVPSKQLPLSPDHWKTPNNTFLGYASSLINDTLSDSLEVISHTAYMDLVSSIAALNITTSTDGLFDAEILAGSASHTFAALIAIITSINQSNNTSATGVSSTALLSPLPAFKNAPRIPTSSNLQVARLQRIPSWIVSVGLCLFAISIPLVWFGK
jgi:hypothetical protein